MYSNPVLCVSAEIPEMNREVAVNRHQSKSHTLEVVKNLRIKRFGFFFRELVATWETTKIQCRKEESQE